MRCLFVPGATLPPVDELLRDVSGIQYNNANAFQYVDPYRVEDLFGIVNAHDRILHCLARELSGAVRLAAFSASRMNGILPVNV